MNNFENDYYGDVQLEPVPLPYDPNSIKKKKRSPYEDSAYVTPYDTQPQRSKPTDAPVDAESQQPQKSRGKKSGGFFRTFVCSLLILALVLGCCLGTAYLVDYRWQKEAELQNRVTEQKIDILQAKIDALEENQSQTGVVPPPEMPEGTLTPSQIYANNVDAVVEVCCVETETDWDGQTSGVITGGGSGFIISDDGYVVSNCHVVEGAEQLLVVTMDGIQYEAELVGADQSNDVSLLKIQGEDLPCVTIGSSDALAVGDQVVAIGNPLSDLTATLTVGYISGKDRVIATEGITRNMLQTDAAINSGNSGGPLFNLYGEVVGITTSKYTGVSNSGVDIESISFAVPIDDAVPVLEDLKEFGYVKTAYLGVYVRSVSEAAQEYGLPAGAFVEEVFADSAAQKAGVQAQDIIVDLGGYDVDSLNSLTQVLRKFQAGEETTITVYRAGKQINMVIILGEEPREVQSEVPEIIPEESTQEEIWDPFQFFSPFFEFPE